MFRRIREERSSAPPNLRLDAAAHGA